MPATDISNTLSLSCKKSNTALPYNSRVSAPDRSATGKLKRMPHLFTRILELPLHAETPVRVVESRDSFQFEMQQPGSAVDNVKVEVLEIVPGATKVLLRGVERSSADVDISEVDLWRFRLPPTTLPEKSFARYDHGTLFITIPKVFVSCQEIPDVKENGSTHSDTSLCEAPCENNSFQGLSSAELGQLETDEERMQREVLEDLESFGSPRRARLSPRASNRSFSPQPVMSHSDLEKTKEALEDLECFGSPRRIRSASCTQSFASHSIGPHQEFFRSVGSLAGRLSVYVQ